MAKKTKARTIGVLDFQKMFPNEETAVAYFEAIRWGSTPTCPRCHKSEKIHAGQKPYQRWCGRCRKYFSAKTGTVMEASNKPIQMWLLAMYFLVTARKGISSLQLSKELSTSQPTAWFILHRIREACGSELEALSGQVELDETYLGGKDKNRHESKKKNVGRGTAGKQAVFGMRERGGATKAMPVEQTNRATLLPMICGTVEPGSTLYTDDHGAYRDVEGLGYDHHVVNHSAKQYVDGMAHTNSVESVWAVLKRGFYGTYHNWSMKHTHRYVNEFTFRLNDGDVQRDTVDRIASLSQALCGKRIRYRELVA
ncbi:MAG: IS1595 family transposase [Nitrospira sp. SB0675_bin_23]|nr:IS1595 family transposase [Nitrospira sp. SB0675_bin_23]